MNNVVVLVQSLPDLIWIATRTALWNRFPLVWARSHHPESVEATRWWEGLLKLAAAPNIFFSCSSSHLCASTGAHDHHSHSDFRTSQVVSSSRNASANQWFASMSSYPKMCQAMGFWGSKRWENPVYSCQKEPHAAGSVVSNKVFSLNHYGDDSLRRPLVWSQEILCILTSIYRS